ncbi:MAG: hypothetical protein ACLQVY_26710 [Limisphaerales bacterium]
MRTLRHSLLLAVSFGLLLCGASVRANVYASDIKLNGSLNAGIIVPGGNLTLSYILNENATAGVSVRIYSGTNVIKTFTAANGLPGTFTGLNSFQWDGAASNGVTVSPGVYTVSITAAAEGYSSWTAITDDSTNFYAFFPTCLTVNKNTNSPYYGRVFVGNCYHGGSPAQAPGIFKYNADGSPDDEGGFGTGGYPWSGGGFFNPNPWKMGISTDDKLYAEDWSDDGVLLSFDQVLSTNYQTVLGPANYPYPGVSLSGACLSGAGTNSQVWMADTTPAMDDGQGVLRWNLSADGTVAAGDTGTVIVAAGDSDLTYAPYDVTVDASGRIYVIQQVDADSTNFNTDLDTMRVLCFPAYHPGEPQDTKALWEMGSGDRPTLEMANGVAVDPTATFVAIASRGEGMDDDSEGGGISILDANSGSLLTNITADPSGITNQVVFDVAWDNVGNLYDVEWSESPWRIYSPPGSNQATTAAVPVIQALNALLPPPLSNPSYAVASSELSFSLLGQSNVTYVIEQSPDLLNWTPVATNYSPNAKRAIGIPLSPSDAQDFYRAVAAP